MEVVRGFRFVVKFIFHLQKVEKIIKTLHFYAMFADSFVNINYDHLPFDLKLVQALNI